ncbi:hypothetical protein BRAS3843_680036 [Bradyrhizobium sp. STM 3843]|uniref:helix-turn-helix domain-containing protein n=1 Tax=Bradyrhizobium sp. STM 3843 TaxID=551947 RepID=UPI0002403756|nr:AraC family transcriptional regulator [Bradyrhizobium sp. STM 3843]CCE11441.1 hypothetical protein BRAS3843_680036 [Bradyrhizobium sp. STM 3843]
MGEHEVVTWPTGPWAADRLLSLGMKRVAGQLLDTTPVDSSLKLSDLVEDITDWDVADDAATRKLVMQVLPGTMTLLLFQYRTPIRSLRRFGSIDFQHPPYCHVATRVQSGIAMVRPNGPLGLVAVQLKPETAAHLLGDCLQGCADIKISLGDVFPPGDVALLAEMLAEAQSSRERVGHVQRFLVAHLCKCGPDRIACQAAARLKRNPSLRVGQLARDLDISERQLSRRFHSMFGLTPKGFARAARVEKALAARNREPGWADVAYACGFADQAHMIHDVNAIVGVPPDQAFRGGAAIASTSLRTG